ncbi:hypothetical protein CIB93_22885 [Streptomyces sp. WZ.A104]|uniref:hypothetical protein n=1 Tax=Streptomyces sp. WZ.A104 TaxID=2023771 RepID=UPI000BBBD3C1|nr:hypothetical protein [Streptomyces sp. WZ.A104]PCG83774.1 hypothetical protein CIB93_22885 [Streptomyces sp. WZ.A104]
MTHAQPLALAAALLDALDPLPHPQRMRELAVRARRLADEGRLRGVLAELEDGDPYERRIASVAAAVGQDAEWCGAHLADEDAVVRGHAFREARHLGVPDAAYETAFADAPAVVRRRLMEAIVADGRTALADRLIRTVRETWGDIEAARLLPGCPAGTVVELLPDLWRSVTCWTSLGRRHPGALLDAAERELTGLLPAGRDAWWQRYAYDRGIAAATPALPHRVLDLLERHGPTRLPVSLHSRLGHLVAADPARFARLLLRPDSCALPPRVLSGTLLRRLVRTLPDALLVELGRSATAPAGRLARLLLALPPGRRAALHEAVTEGRGEGTPVAVVDTELLDALPRTRVTEVARRLADRARTRGANDLAVLTAESYLPFAETRERLLAATRRPAADDRGEAWSLLVRNAGRTGDPSPVATVLEDLLRLRNEQDLVRQYAMKALLCVKPALFTDAVEPLLDRIAADAVEARDSSTWTRSALSSLALAVLREHAVTGQRALVNWALRTLVRITGNSGSADLGRLDRALRRGQEHTVFDALRPWLEAGAERSDYGLVLALARAVGRRAEGMPGLQELLWQAVNHGGEPTARSAAALWLRAPADRDARVGRLLARDPSAAALPDVQRVLTHRRTDLLDGYLDGAPPVGRFLRPGTPWTVGIAGAERWTPCQQRAAQRALERTASDEKLPLYARATALWELARVPGRGADAVRAWTNAPDVVLAEAALAALAYTDRPADTLPDLLAHTGDDRARVAVYAASRAATFARPSRLAGLLAARTAPGTGKVTGRKEMVRLAAALLPRAGAAALLADAYGQPDQHPDVRAACVASGTPLLGEARMWEVMESAAGEVRALRVAVLRAHPLELDPAHRPRYARLVQQVCDAEDDALAALAHGALVPWLPWAPHAAAVLMDAVTELDRRGRWRSAADALVEAALTTPEAAVALNRALGRLATGETADDAGAERDRPARQRLGHLTGALARRTGTHDRQGAAVLGEAGRTLAAHRDLVPDAVSLLARSLDLEADPDTLHTDLVRLAALHTGRPALAARTALTVGRRVAGPGGVLPIMPGPPTGHPLGIAGRPGTETGDPDTLLVVVARLAGTGDPAEGLFAAELTVAGGRRTEWTGPWRTQLRMLRQHPSGDVRDVAYAEVTAQE